MFRTQKFTGPLLGGLLLILGGTSLLSCSSNPRSKMFSTWKEPQGPPGPYQSVVVIALARNESTRRIAEDEFVKTLPGNVKGFTSYTTVSKENEGDADKVVAELKAKGIQGAAIMRLVEERTTAEYDPGSISTNPFNSLNSMNNYYGRVWLSYRDTGYLTSETAVRVETAFFSVADAKRVWTGYSETMNPKSSQVVIDDVARLVVRELRREKIIE